jgi:hypothetical protein
METQATKFKQFLASSMAQVDALNFTNENYEQHYSKLMKWRDFDLLHYWLTYNGVFDGGESMLNHIKILIDDSPTCNPNSVIENLEDRITGMFINQMT